MLCYIVEKEIVDDHPFFREGLKSLLARHPRFKVVAEAANGDEGLRKAKKLRPELVVMDISLPDSSGFEVTRNIRDFVPETRVTILSMHSEIEYVAKAFRAGAKGYVVKESATQRFLECLEAVSRGEHLIDPLLLVFFDVLTSDYIFSDRMLRLYLPGSALEPH